jgi:hypothetical protein
MNTTHTKQTKAIDQLSTEVARVADALETQNSARKRFVMGVVFGVGTAIGASIIASVLVLIFSQTLSAVGLSQDFLGQDAESVIEEQINIQTPQN